MCSEQATSVVAPNTACPIVCVSSGFFYEVTSYEQEGQTFIAEPKSKGGSRGEQSSGSSFFP